MPSHRFTGYNKDARSSHGIHRDLEGELKFHLRRERRRICVIRDVKIRDDSEDALLFLGLEWRGCHLDGVVMNINSGALGCNVKLDTGDNFELARTHYDREDIQSAKPLALMLS